MGAMTPVPMDDPLMIAWKAYQATTEYANTKKWALHEPHVDGSLWAAFVEGWSRSAALASTPGGPRLDWLRTLTFAFKTEYADKHTGYFDACSNCQKRWDAHDAECPVPGLLAHAKNEQTTTPGGGEREALVQAEIGFAETFSIVQRDYDDPALLAHVAAYLADVRDALATPPRASEATHEGLTQSQGESHGISRRRRAPVSFQRVSRDGRGNRRDLPDVPGQEVAQAPAPSSRAEGGGAESDRRERAAEAALHAWWNDKSGGAWLSVVDAVLVVMAPDGGRDGHCPKCGAYHNLSYLCALPMVPPPPAIRDEGVRALLDRLARHHHDKCSDDHTHRRCAFGDCQALLCREARAILAPPPALEGT